MLHFNKTSNPNFDILNWFGGSSSASLIPILPISKPLGFGFDTFFENKKLSGLVQKLSLVPCRHYTFLNAIDCIGTQFYN